MKGLMNHKIIIPRHITIMLAMALGFNFLRMAIFGSYSYAYMFWNIFLAFLPFFIGYALVVFSNSGKLTNSLFVVGSLAWLFLLPNSFYLVTDLIHLSHGRMIPVIFDTLMFFSSAELGVYLGIHSVLQMEEILNKRYSQVVTRRVIPVIIILTSFGMYLGRFLRFNSWDILTNTFSLSKEVFRIISHPVIYKDAYLYTILFSVFVYLSLIAYKKINIK